MGKPAPKWLVVGATVDYSPIIGEPATQFGFVVRAVEHRDRSWVAWLHGKSGFVVAEALTPSASEPAPKTDGLGNPLLPEGRYYVQDSRSVVGNCGSWWAPNGAGYVCNIHEAGIYDGDHVKTMRSTDVPWPVEHVLKHSVTHIRVDNQAFNRDLYKPGPR